MKVLLVFGTRPEAIKMAPLVHAFRRSRIFDPFVCVTGQHREMLDQVLNMFDIHPDFDLNVMRPGQDLIDVTSDVLIGIKSVISSNHPELILVHGDTTTAMTSALAGFYSGISVGHVEAGLRTFNIHSPYPEEFNRQFISRVADLHFAPTEKSRRNLLNEGVNSSVVTVTGNTVIDALFWAISRIETNDDIKNSILKKLNKVLKFDYQFSKFILITGHRRENFGAGFQNICTSIAELAKKYKNIHFVYPVHLNPKVRNVVFEQLSSIDNIHLIDPLEYEPFIYLLKHCYFVLTDSGGIQEEAPSLGKPVLVMRSLTERPEGVESGNIKLIGTDVIKIVFEVSLLLDSQADYQQMACAENPYGDGKASDKILSAIQKHFEL